MHRSSVSLARTRPLRGRTGAAGIPIDQADGLSEFENRQRNLRNCPNSNHRAMPPAASARNQSRISAPVHITTPSCARMWS
jgi:hypothetical protein